MKIKNFLTAVFMSFCILPTVAFAGSAFYVDCSDARNGDGSFSNPWNKIASVNNHNFNKGDDVYFKKGSTCILTSDSDRLQVDWSGVNESDSHHRLL